MEKKRVGRPPGSEFPERMDIPLRDGTKSTLRTIAEQDGTTPTALVRDLIERYIKRRRA